MPDTAKIKGLINHVFQNGGSELVLRVVRYDYSNETSSFRPVSFQAIVRYADATLPWAVKIDENCFNALASALIAATEQNESCTNDRQSEYTTKTKDSAGLLQQNSLRRVIRFPNLARKRTGKSAKAARKRDKSD
jgi:hypothetical protein